MYFCVFKDILNYDCIEYIHMFLDLRNIRFCKGCGFATVATDRFSNKVNFSSYSNDWCDMCYNVCL